MKKKRAIVFCGTSNFAFAMASVIMDLKRVSPGIADEIVIIHDGKMLDKDKQIIASLWTTRFIDYAFPFTDLPVFNQGFFNYFTKMVCAKFECLRLLQDYATVLFTDYDIVITKDISELMAPCDSGIRMIPYPGSYKVASQLLEPYRNLSIEDYDLQAQGFCAATFVFQDHLNDYMKMYSFCYSTLKKYASFLYMPEQAVFDFMIQRFQLVVDSLDPAVYIPHPDDRSKHAQAKILHAYGNLKFWNGIKNEQWQKNYSEWLKMGGSRYTPTHNGVKDRLAHFMTRFRYHLKRRRRFNAS